MPWEQRGKNRYYYRREYQNGKETRVYFGRGIRAEIAAAEDVLNRAIRQQEKAERKLMIREKKFNRTMIEGAIVIHREQYKHHDFYIDRDGNARRRNARTKRNIDVPPITPPTASEESPA